MNAPVPGPSSITHAALWIDDAPTIACAKKGEDGQIAPTDPGARRKALRKPKDIAAGSAFASKSAIRKNTRIALPLRNKLE